MSIEKQNETATLVEHELALKVYIDALLLDTEFEAQTGPKVTAPLKLQEESIDTPLTQASLASTVVVAESQHIVALEDSNKAFDCLVFKVAGFLTLAVPLECLNGILRWSGDLTSIPGHAEWFLGLASIRGKQVKVIDIAKFVIPENHKSRQAVEGERHFKHLLLIDDGQLALACDDLGKVLKLTTDKVRWRQDRSSRPWLAGTIIEQMSALIDVERFTELLKKGVALDEIS